jgi:AcrR family transcriptional regulator
VTDKATTSTPRRGRPRSEKAREAILDAAAELLLARGLQAVSMDAVAERAGVSKATIYRWWRTKETLALDALYHHWDDIGPQGRDTGSLRGDLLSIMRHWIRLVTNRPYARIVAALITEAQTDPAFGEQYRERFLQPRRDHIRQILQRAIQRGELPQTTDTELALDMLYGPLYHRLLQGHAPLNDRFVRKLVDTTLAGLASARHPADPQRHRAGLRSERDARPSDA